MATMLALLHGNELPLLVILLVIALLLGVFLYRRLRRPAPVLYPVAGPVPLEVAAPEPQMVSPGLMRAAFRGGLAAYRNQVAGSNNPYLVPWFLAVATPDSGLTALCTATEAPRPPVALPDPVSGKPVGVTWWFHDQAVVLEVASDAFLRGDGMRIADLTWASLLSELVRSRDALPLDGIVLALSATDFGGPAALDAHALHERAIQIYGRLWQAQRTLGTSLPIWVVITRCDVIPGFRGLAEALPAWRRQEAIGWSSPYALEASFQPHWIDEAISALQDSLIGAGLELVASSADGKIGSDTLELPRELDRLRLPLATLLGQIFRQTAFQESLYFRGIWLTGAAGMPRVDAVTRADAMRLDAAQPASPPLAFVRDLFSRKIFPEQGLPRPAARWAQNAAKMQLAWRAGLGVAFVVAAVLLWTGADRLVDMRAGYVPVLRALEAPVRLARQAELGAPPVPGLAVPGAPQAMRAIGRIDQSWREPVFPVAMLDQLEERVATALSVAHWRLMMADIQRGLSRKAAAIAAGDGEEADAPARNGIQKIRNFVGEVLLLQSHVDLFAALRTDGGTEGLAELLEYATGLKLAPGYGLAGDDIGFTALPPGRSLRGATLGAAGQPVDDTRLRRILQPRLRELSSAYFRRQVSSGNLNLDLAVTAQRINALAEPQSAVLSVPPLLPSIESGLSLVGEQMQASDGLWLTSASNSVGPPSYRELLQLIAGAPLLGPLVRDSLVADAKGILGTVDEKPNMSSIIGPLLAMSGERNRLELAPPAAALGEKLAALNKRPFMQASQGPAAGRDLRVGLARWDVRPLEQAVAMAGNYTLFLVQDAPSLPAPVLPGVRAIAQDRLIAALFDAVQRAQVDVSADLVGGVREADLKAMAASTVAAAPLFRRLGDALRQAEAPAAANRLMLALGMQSVAVLDQASQILESGSAYLPPPSLLAGWREGGMDLAVLYGQPDMTAMGGVMERERVRIAGLLRDVVAPVLAVLGRGDLQTARNSAAARQWAGIAQDLDITGQKRPGGSLVALEQFILVDLPALKPGSCPNLGGGGASPNWFAAQQGRLRDQLAQRCAAATDRTIANAYNEISGAFRANLANRYPFAPLSQAETGPYASIEEVAAFYRAFDPAASEIGVAVAAQGGVPPAQRGMLQFVDTMRRMRLVLAPLAGLDGQPDPGLWLEPRFRALPNRDQGGSEVIGWQLQTADATSEDPSHKPVLYRLGDRLKIGLRWAQNAPHQPVSITNALRGDLTDRTVTAIYDDPWALVTLIRQHRPDLADWTPGPGRIPHMLAFTVPTSPAGEQRLADTQSRLFIELALRAAPAVAGGRLMLPDFPTAAPEPGSAAIRAALDIKLAPQMQAAASSSGRPLPRASDIRTP